LTDPPVFKPVAREEALPDDARSVLGFVRCSGVFQKARIARLWAAVGPSYEAQMDRWDRRFAKLSPYRLLSASSVRRCAPTKLMKVVVELGAPQNSVNVRSHQDDYYVVLGYAATPKVDEIRHAYLHLRLNNDTTARPSKVGGRSGLMTLLFGAVESSGSMPTISRTC
jgi:hypothetical protein